MDDNIKETMIMVSFGVGLVILMAVIIMGASYLTWRDCYELTQDKEYCEK